MVACGAALLAAPAQAGPPFLTDDPVPTDIGHWEMYAFSAAEGRRSDFDGAAGLDLNYGPVKGLQLTATLPLSFSHVRGEGWQGGSGYVELGVKYRFFQNDERVLSASIFPRVILPTAAHSPDEKTRLLLPLWIGKDFAGDTSVFGGGGYLINPGSGNRNVWQVAIAVTHELSEQFLVGAEVTQQGADVVGGTAQTRAGLGAIIHLSGPASLLFSGGPTWADRQTGYHLYGAIGFVY